MITACHVCRAVPEAMNGTPTPASPSVCPVCNGETPLTTITPPVVRQTHLPPTIAGYDILAEVGRGGMGVVYKAARSNRNRDVALKVILRNASPIRNLSSGFAGKLRQRPGYRIPTLSLSTIMTRMATRITWRWNSFPV